MTKVPKERKTQPVATGALKYEIINAYIETGNYNEVARRFNRSKSGVRDLIKRFMLNNTEEYERMVKLYMTQFERQLLYKNNHLMDKSLEEIESKLDSGDSPLNHLAMTYGILYDKSALMQGKSTSNQAVIVKLDGDLKDLAK